MQRRNALKLKSECKFDCLETGLSKPEDEQLFYSASVQFLRKKLEEKSHHQSLNVRGPAQKDQESCHTKSTASSLSMRQLLPFPKSSKDGFFTRLRNTFRKFQLRVPSLNTDDEDLQSSNITSNFKFARCEKCERFHSSHMKNAWEQNLCVTYKVTWVIPNKDDFIMQWNNRSMISVSGLHF